MIRWPHKWRSLWIWGDIQLNAQFLWWCLRFHGPYLASNWSIHTVGHDFKFPLWSYCWRRKSCTTWDVHNPVNSGINYLSTGAGFLPPTVVRTVIIWVVNIWFLLAVQLLLRGVFEVHPTQLIMEAKVYIFQAPKSILVLSTCVVFAPLANLWGIFCGRKRP